MKLVLIVFVLLGTISCQDSSSNNPFLDEVIRKYGKDGQAVYEKGNNTYCVSIDEKPYKPILVGEKIGKKDKIVVCVLQEAKWILSKQKSAEYVPCGGTSSVKPHFCCSDLVDCVKLYFSKNCGSSYSCVNCPSQGGRGCCCEAKLPGGDVH